MNKRSDLMMVRWGGVNNKKWGLQRLGMLLLLLMNGYEDGRMTGLQTSLHTSINE